MKRKVGGDQVVENLHILLGIYFFLVGNVEKYEVMTSFFFSDRGRHKSTIRKNTLVAMLRIN